MIKLIFELFCVEYVEWYRGGKLLFGLQVPSIMQILMSSLCRLVGWAKLLLK